MQRGLWLVAPILAAGLLHVAVIALDLGPSLARPVDGGRGPGGRPLFGRNKTWRGFVVMPIATALTVVARDALLARAPVRRRYPRAPSWLIGAACGAAYVLAELPNSFLKRRLGIAPGGRTRHVPVAQYLSDQLDSVIGCVLAVRAFYRIDLVDTAVATAMGGGFHIAVERGMRILPRRRRARP